jgi:hypothetical protein
VDTSHVVGHVGEDHMGGDQVGVAEGGADAFRTVLRPSDSVTETHWPEGLLASEATAASQSRRNSWEGI